MENWSKQKKRISSYYDALVTRFGHDPRACDYGRQESQTTKFRVLSEVMPLAGMNILDVGCGFGDFGVYLRKRFDGVHYVGVDISPAMVGKARQVHPNLDIRQTDILNDDISGVYDLVTANGIFYLIDDDAPTLMQKIITRMYELSRMSVAFNSLSSWAPDIDQGEFHADPIATLEFCLSLTHQVVLRADYHPRDFTIYLYKDGDDRLD